MTAKPIRDGFHTVTPYLFTEGSARLIKFLCEAFNAEVINRKDRPDGAVMHAEMRIGDSMVMLGEASGEFGPMPTSTCPIVTPSTTKRRSAGGISVFEIMNLPSGERYGGVKDPFGNIWWIATHVEDLSPEEQERRWREFKR
jgi:PhnB protein